MTSEPMALIGPNARLRMIAAAVASSTSKRSKASSTVRPTAITQLFSRSATGFFGPTTPAATSSPSPNWCSKGIFLTLAGVIHTSLFSSRTEMFPPEVVVIS